MTKICANVEVETLTNRHEATVDFNHKDFKKIPDYNYYINKKGLVVNSKKQEVKQRDAQGYKTVGLARSGENKMFNIHRLVATVFIGDIPEGYVVNHIDGNKSNNDVANLEIITQKENIQHAVTSGLLKPRNTHIEDLGGEWKKYPSSPNYEASTLGQVRNSLTGTVMHPDKVKRSLIVNLKLPNGRQAKRSVQSIVVETHIRHVQHDEVIFHKDGNVENNNVSNLAIIHKGDATIEKYAAIQEFSDNDKSEEVWKTVDKYPELEISSHHRLRYKNNGRVCSHPSNVIQLKLDGSRVRLNLINLMVEAFLGEISDNEELCFVDGNHFNYTLSNLEINQKKEKKKALDPSSEIKEISNSSWKTLPSCNKYEISDKGQVRNAKNKRILKPSKEQYHRVKVNEKKQCVHRLVAETFIGNIPEGYVVNHIDGDKHNNNVKNLEIITYKENVKHAAHELQDRKVGDVKIFVKETGETLEFPSVNWAERELFGRETSTFQKMLKKKQYENAKFIILEAKGKM